MDSGAGMGVVESFPLSSDSLRVIGGLHSHGQWRWHGVRQKCSGFMDSGDGTGFVGSVPVSLTVARAWGCGIR